MRTLLIPAALLATAFVCSPLALAGTTPAASASTAKADSSHAHHRHHHRQHHMHHRGMHALRKLDLTESQRTSIHKLMRENFQQAKARMHDLQQKRMAFEKATPGTADYQSATDALAKAMASAAQARVMRRADLKARIYNLLTTEQRAKLADLRAQRQARMAKWRASHKHHMTRPASSAK